MEKNFFTAKTEGKREGKGATQAPAPLKMTHISKHNYNKNICLTSTRTHLLFKNIWRTSRPLPCRNSLSNPTPANSRNKSNNLCKSCSRQKMSASFTSSKRHLWPILCLLMTLIYHAHSFDMTMSRDGAKRVETSTTMRYSQLLSTSDLISMHDDAKDTKADDTFRPFVPKEAEQISHNVFTPSGQFRVFQPIDTDLRAVAFTRHKSQPYGKSETLKVLNAAQSQTNKTTTQQLNRRSQKKSKDILKTTRGEAKVEQTSSKKSLHEKPQQQQQQQTEIKHHDFGVKHHKHQTDHQQQQQPSRRRDEDDAEQNEISKWDDFKSDLKSLDDLLVEYVANYFEKGLHEPTPGLLFELQNTHNPNRSQPLPNAETNKTRAERQSAATEAEDRIDLPRTLQTGRLLFLTGLKKVLWPVFMGLQILKSLLIAMFIPAIIGSFTKLLGKGISTGSAPLFIRPMEPPQELDFRDNNLAFEEDNKFLIMDDGAKVNGPYNYNQADTSHMHNEYVFDPSSSNNQLSFTRLGMNERQHQLMQDSYMSALQSIGSASFKNSGSLSTGSSGLVAPMAKRPPAAANVNTFQQFQKVPDSSLLLSNYDPFYSPLLSRLDSVFAQLKINSDKELCREKLICLMYANPAKYAPYSNLVSAQLSRELNELRKPTSDNPDILRFFKYMRAAKDGQDGVDCEKTFDTCTEFKDFENPAMVSTYHDINKLVQARKFNSK